MKELRETSINSAEYARSEDVVNSWLTKKIDVNITTLEIYISRKR